MCDAMKNDVFPALNQILFRLSIEALRMSAKKNEIKSIFAIFLASHRISYGDPLVILSIIFKSARFTFGRIYYCQTASRFRSSHQMRGTLAVCDVRTIVRT